MTKKFWKFVNEDGCSPGGYGVIKYTQGETVEVKNTNLDKERQCASGIHCIDFSDKQYDPCSIMFGPKVAILEVDEENIVYYEKNGKCRVKKAKVLEVKEPELWMRTGNGNMAWTLDCSVYCWHHPDIMQVIIDSRSTGHAYRYARDILERHDEKLMQVIINSGDAYYAYAYAKDVLKGHDERLMQVIIDQNIHYTYYYAKDVLKGHDEKLMKVIIDAQDAYYAYCYALDVLKGHDEKLMEIANNDPYYKDLYEENILNKEKNND